MADDTNTPLLIMKGLAAFEIKDATKGEVEAVVATLGVVDRDEDIIRKGAIADGSTVVVSAYGHDAVFGSMPAGKGTLSTRGNEVVFKGRMFLGTTAGHDSFEVMKEMGGDQEWSFGFRVLGYEVPSEAEQKMGARRILTKLDAFEVSPVIVGAGIGTRTLAVKAAAQADGDGALAPTAEEIAELARVAEAKAAQDAIDAKSAADAEAARKSHESDAVKKELDRMLRTNRLYGS